MKKQTTMKISFHQVQVEHEKFGSLVQESFLNFTQFKLFLMQIHGALEMKEALSFYNGSDMLVHIPYKFLVDSIILTKSQEADGETNISEHFRSKIEALVTKEES